jgi:hypothetical protein
VKSVIYFLEVGLFDGGGSGNCSVLDGDLFVGSTGGVPCDSVGG